MSKPMGLRPLILTAICLAVVFDFAPAQSAKRPITLDDLTRIRSVGDPQRSPDGRWVVYTVGTVDVEKDKRNTDLWMISWDGTQQVPLTFTPDGESAPRWSPDGRSLAFLAAAARTKKRNGARRFGCSTGPAARPRSSPTSKGGSANTPGPPTARGLSSSSMTRILPPNRRSWTAGNGKPLRPSSSTGIILNRTGRAI
jgi:dipeptidyl aminopeptidase/acylaminoacyl peptidase